MTQAQERALVVDEAARAKVAAERAEARVRAALRAMLAVDPRVTAATLRWELRDEDGGGAWLVARVAVTIGGVSTWPPVSDATSEALDALTPPPDWRALADAEDAVTREAFGAAGHDGEEWTEARQ